MAVASTSVSGVTGLDGVETHSIRPSAIVRIPA
jgi:hypothetical protein